MFELVRFKVKKLPGWANADRRALKTARGFMGDYLGPKGWARSVTDRNAVNLDGPIPWYTYAAIRELERVIPRSAKVFEYGSGNSSLWWNTKAAQVVSVEHDQGWYEHSAGKTSGGSGADVRLRTQGDQTNAAHHAELADILGQYPQVPGELDAKTALARGVVTEGFESYIAELLTFPDKHFDIIIVDGMAREACARVAMRRLKDGGFIVFDNSDRREYQGAYNTLVESGFARMDYWSPGPINPYEWCTSIFTKSLDIFGIAQS